MERSMMEGMGLVGGVVTSELDGRSTTESPDEESRRIES